MSRRPEVLRNLFLIELFVWPLVAFFVALWIYDPHLSGWVFRVNNIISTASISCMRRMLRRFPGCWRYWSQAASIWLFHYLMYQTLTERRMSILIRLVGLEPGAEEYQGNSAEGYVLVWCCLASLVANFVLCTSLVTSLVHTFFGPVMFALQVFLVSTSLDLDFALRHLAAYTFVCIVSFVGARQIDLAYRMQFLQSRELERELATMQTWHTGVQRILAVNFDVFDTIDQDLVVPESSQLRSVLDPKGTGMRTFYTFGEGELEQKRLQDFFLRLQNNISTDPGLFHGPDKITTTMRIEGTLVEFEVETIWMPRTCQDTTGSFPHDLPGNLWVGLRCARDQDSPAKDGEDVEAPEPSKEADVEVADVQRADKEKEASEENRSQDNPSRTDSRTDSSLATTTRTGNVFADLSRLRYSEEASQAKMKEHLQHIVQIGQRENWLLSTQELQLLPDRLLGFGGYGMVVGARLYGTEVAVKLPRSPGGAKTSIRYVISMANELRILRKVRHPNVVVFHGACIDPTSLEVCLVSELVQGVQLDMFIGVPPLPPGKIGRHQLSMEVSSALCYLHAQDPPIIHGDLKPANVMVERRASSLRAKVLDFGLSRMQTKHAMPLGGTLSWKAPELLRKDGSITPAPSADVFSFGLFIYFAMTGLKPFRDIPNSAIVHMLKKGRTMPCIWPTEAAFSEECQALCGQCVVVDASARPMMQVVQKMLASWRSSPDDGGETSAAGSPRGWDDIVQELQGTVNKGTRRSLKRQEPNSALMCPGFRETPETTKRLTMAFTLATWNLALSPDACCPWHAALLEAAMVIQRLQEQCCSQDPPPISQCGQCGALKRRASRKPECDICRQLNSKAPDSLRHLGLTQDTRKHICMSL